MSTTAAITKTRTAAGAYRYMTPLGNFGVTGGRDGWSLDQWTPEHGS